MTCWCRVRPVGLFHGGGSDWGMHACQLVSRQPASPAACPARWRLSPGCTAWCRPPPADINKHPAQLTAMIAPLVPLLHPGGALIFTLK